MTWISGLKITVLVGYAATRFFYRDNVILASVFFGAYSVLLGYFAFDLFRHYRQLGSLEKALAESLRQQLGDKVSRYVLFEVKIMAGAANLLLSPVSSPRRASQSYFVQSADRAVFWLLLFLMVAEPIMLHLAISAMKSASVRLYAHSALILLEVYGVGFILGNIYYLGFSAIVVGPPELSIKLGEVWQVETTLCNLKKVEFDIVRGLDSGVAKIALSSGPYTRLYFHRQVSARFLFFEQRLDVVDVCLRPGERNAFKKMSADKGER